MSAVSPYLLFALQLFFTLSWTIYVLFLPQLAAGVGIPKSAIILLLMLDQAIFAVMDWTLGVHADRVASVVKRLGGVIAILTAVSTMAFLLLPLLAPTGNPALLMALIVVWSVTSSVLRAPPLVLLSRLAGPAEQPRIAAWFMFGLGVAGALSPYLTLTLRNADPRLPFALCSVAVLVTTLVLTRLDAVPDLPAPVERPPFNRRMGLFLAAALLLGAGFQIHFALNAAPRYLKLAPADQLPWLMPLFWVGFNLAVFPVMHWLQRGDALRVMTYGAVMAALAAFLAGMAGNLALLVTAELLAGIGWALAMVAVVAGALALGSTGREGFVTGGVFALFALATFLRMGLAASGIDMSTGLRDLLQWAAVSCWLMAAFMLWMAAGSGINKQRAGA